MRTQRSEFKSIGNRCPGIWQSLVQFESRFLQLLSNGRSNRVTQRVVSDFRRDFLLLLRDECFSLTAQLTNLLFDLGAFFGHHLDMCLSLRGRHVLHLFGQLFFLQLRQDVRIFV